MKYIHTQVAEKMVFCDAGPQAFTKGDQMNVLAYGLIITVLGGHPTIAKFIYVLVFSE